MASDLPKVGLDAVIENLAAFQAGAISIEEAYTNINNAADDVETSTGAASGALTGLGSVAGTVAAGGMALVVAAAVAVVAGLVAVGVAFVGMSKAALGASQDLESASNALIIGTGASGKALEEMEDIVLSLSESSAGVDVSYKEMGGTVAEVNTRLGLTGKELETTSAAMLKFSRLTGGDAVKNTQLITRVMGDWGVEIDDTEKLLDTIFGASQAFGISTDAVAQKVVQFGAPLRAMDFTLEESIALFGKWEKEGVNAELAIGSLRIASGKFAKDGVPLREGLDATMEAIKGAATESEGLAIAMDVFGARAGPDMAAAIREGRFELDDAIKSLQGTSGGLEDAADRTLTFSNKMEIMWNKAKNALLPFGDAMLKVADDIMPLLDETLENLKPALEDFAVLLQDGLTEAVKVLIPWIKDILIPALSDFGEWLVNVGVPALREFAIFVQENVIPAIREFAIFVQTTVIPAIKEFATFIQENVIPVITNLWAMFSQSSEQSEKVKTAFSEIMAVLNPFIEVTMKNLLDIWNVIKGWTDENWPLIQKTIVTVITFIRDIIDMNVKMIQQIWDKWGDKIMAVTKFIFKTIFSVVKTQIENILSTIKIVMQIITGDWRGAWEEILSIVERSTELQNQIVDAAMSAMWQSIKGFMTSIKNTISGIWANINIIVKTKIEEMKATISGIFTNIKTIIEVKMNDIKNTISGIWDNIKTIVAAKVKDMMNKIVSTIGGFANKIKDALFGVINSAIGGIGSINVSQVGRNIIDGIIQGINDAKGQLQDALGGVMDLIPTWLSDFIQSGSAARITMPIGKDLMSGIQVGVASKIPDLMQTLQASVSAPIVAATPTLGASNITNITNITNELGGNNISSEMDSAVFEARVLDVIINNVG